MQNFLNQYHYLSSSRSGNHDVDSAIRHFQRFAGLKVTGRLDSATIRQMRKPRCGMPDDAAGSDRVRRYKTGSKWRKTSLTYFIQFGRDLPQGTQERIFRKALQYWADVSALSFTRTSSPQRADLKIRYKTVYHSFFFFFTLLDLLFIGYLQLHTLPKKFPFTLCCCCFFSFSFDYFRYRKFLGTELNSVVLYVFDRGHYLLT